MPAAANECQPEITKLADHIIEIRQGDLEKLESRVEELTKALEKIRSYNVDIAAGRINYRPHDHIQVVDEVLS